MNVNRLFLVVLSFSLIMGVVGSAKAYDGLWNCNYGHPWWNYHPQSITVGPLPYFAWYSPVYYSHWVPRPYGWSPMAYPAGVLTPNESRGVRPQPAPRAEPTLARQPLRIANPYVAQSEEVPAPEPSAPASPAPKVVHPALLDKPGL
jgi:hypothetical protein